VTDIVNGLAATPTRKALLRAIAYDTARISYDPREGVVWDHVAGRRVTDAVTQMLLADWIRALTPDEPRALGELKFRTYYRLKTYGETALHGARNSIEEKSNGA
jgi:hypothetical protein